MKVSKSTTINRVFYINLRDIGRSHLQIMGMIQPIRREQFYNDIEDIIKPKHKWWKELIYAFKNRRLRSPYEL